MAQITAVDHISFSLAQGTTVALLGGNGAGKTTTIAMLLGLVMPSSGEVQGVRRRYEQDRGSVAHRLNFQSPYVDLPARLTVKQNLTVYAGLYGIGNAVERIAHVAHDLQIEPIARPPDRQTVGRAEDPRRPRQGAAQRAGASFAR